MQEKTCSRRKFIGGALAMAPVVYLGRDYPFYRRSVSGRPASYSYKPMTANMSGDTLECERRWETFHHSIEIMDTHATFLEIELDNLLFSYECQSLLNECDTLLHIKKNQTNNVVLPLIEEGGFTSIIGGDYPYLGRTIRDSSLMDLKEGGQLFDKARHKFSIKNPYNLGIMYRDGDNLRTAYTRRQNRAYKDGEWYVLKYKLEIKIVSLETSLLLNFEDSVYDN